MRRTRDLSQYRDILPYASEIFGVYQPMLGWRSRRIRARIEKGFRGDLARVFRSLYGRFKGRFEFSLDDRRSLEAIRRLEPAELRAADQLLGGSFVLESVARRLPPLEDYNDSIWEEAIRPERIDLVKPGADCQLAGTVENIVYFGTDTHFHIDLDTGGDVTVRVQNRRGFQEVLKQGDAVGLRIAPEAMQVLKD